MIGTTEATWDELTGAPWDAVVIGAGPAGTIAALGLAGAGARVLLVEKKPFPREKVCGGCLNGRALTILGSAGLGSVVARAGGVTLRELGLGFQGRFRRLTLPCGSAIARARLDAELLAAATNSGARFLSETCALVGATANEMRLVHLKRRGVACAISARVVLVAAGIGNCCLPAGSATAIRLAPGRWIGAGCLIMRAPSFYGNGTIFMAVGRAGYVGLVRLGDGSLNVAAALQPEFLRSRGSPAAAASLILADARFPSIDGLEAARWQGTAPYARRARPLAQDRLFLLGDAAGYVEPFTGEGIAWALASGRAVAPLALRAIERWSPSLARDWDELHRRLVRSRQIVSRAAAAALRRPWLADLGFEALARMPVAAGLILKYLNGTPFVWTRVPRKVLF